VSAECWRNLKIKFETDTAKIVKNLSKMTRDEKTSLARFGVWVKLRRTYPRWSLDCQRRHSQASKVPGIVEGRFLSRNILILLEA
jgi:hypothetical protein